MSTLGLDRLRYWETQKLKSSDFANRDRREGILRAWHNRALHETGGSIFGLAVTLTADSAQVKVACGLAYDCAGRELWLPVETKLALPRANAPRWLLLAPRGLVWAEPHTNNPSSVPLAELYFEGETPKLRYAPRLLRPLARPLLATGSTLSGNTPWEIWLIPRPGDLTGLNGIPVGVQTRIDTAAAGFTRIPHYFARLEAPDWDLKSVPPPEFVPAYFSHVAEAATNGFTFRLLLKDIATRTLTAVNATGIVQSVVSFAGGTAQRRVELDDAEDFAATDMVAMVRPRGDRAVLLGEREGESYRVASSQLFANDKAAALGNLPRVSRVASVTEQAFTTLTVEGTPPASGSLVATRPSGSATVVGVTGNSVRLDRILRGASADNEFRVALSQRLRVTEKPVVEGGLMQVKVGSSVAAVGDWVVALSGSGNPQGIASEVRSLDGRTLSIEPALPSLTSGARLAVFRQPVNVTNLSNDRTERTIQVDRPQMFRAGDVVIVSQRPAQPAVIVSVDDDQIAVSPSSFEAAAGDVLVAGNWKGAVSSLALYSFGAFQFVIVAEPALVRPGNFLMSVTLPAPPNPVEPVEPDLSKLALVTAVAGSGLITTPASGLGRESLLLVLEFPASGAVSAVSGSTITVPNTPIAAGDWLAVLDDADGELSLVPVSAAAPGGVLTLGGAFDNLLAGARVGVVHFREPLDAEPDDGEEPALKLSLEVDRREGDFIARFTHWVDNSSWSRLASKAADVLTLSPGLGFGVPADGIVPAGLIDGGVLALASLKPNQNHLRLAPQNTVEAGDEMTATGPSPVNMDQSLRVRARSFDAGTGGLDVDPLQSVNQPYAFRPERLALISSYNDRFPEAFAVFAQRQKLFVSWVACLDQPRTQYPCESEPQPDECGCNGGTTK
ncbi:MAG: hypothetical protein SFV54_18135 [Bryobacteraceae bacterium]|nr:hypothetical protein [Bryobacteraceae bacterium]